MQEVTLELTQSEKNRIGNLIDELLKGRATNLSYDELFNKFSYFVSGVKLGIENSTQTEKHIP